MGWRAVECLAFHAAPQPSLTRFASLQHSATSSTTKPSCTSSSGYKRSAVISAAIFFGAMGLSVIPETLDRPLTLLFNGYANRSTLIDTLISDLANYFTYSGVILMALIYACWFDTEDLEKRSQILIGTLVSFAAGCVSRLLQYTLSTHPRPFFDPELPFHPPSGLGEQPLNTWNSFPSDHATVFAGLVVVIYLAKPTLAVFAAAFTVLVESLRVYMGAHYPSDLIGGAALAAMMVWTAQTPRVVSLGRRMAGWERTSPSLFYMFAFFITYQIATLFVDVRHVVGHMRELSHASVSSGHVPHQERANTALRAVH
jgi:membrane-associated phospholipid phosphatase